MKHYCFVLLAILLAASAEANQRAQGFCEKGGQVVVTSGISSSTTIQQSYPSCTVTVYINNTVTLATIYSDNSNTPLANPFTASSNGQWYFYAANGRYDIAISGSGLSAPFTFGDVLLADPVSGPPGVTSISGNNGITCSPSTGSANCGIKPTVERISSDYDFTPQSPTSPSSLSIGANSVTMSPCPLGVTLPATGYSVWVAGTGTPEEATLIGGTCTSGASSGTFIITVSGTHSGGYTISSIDAGIQEAICSLSSGGTVVIPAGSYTLNGNATFCGQSNVVLSVLSGAIFSGSGSLPSYFFANNDFLSSPNPGPGAVVMHHEDATDIWIVTKPDGSILDTSGTTTKGLQEAINYAFPNGYSLKVYGGWAQTGNPSHGHSLLSLGSTVSVPPVAIADADFYGVQIECDVTGADCFYFDTSDMLNWDMHHSETYVGSGTPTSLFHFAPRNDNGESLVAMTAATIHLGEVVPNVGGTGVRFTEAYNASCCANGHGLIVNNRYLDIGNVNGGATCVQVDTPDGRTATSFNANGISGSCQNQSGSALVIGTSATAPGNGNPTGLYIRGNRWDMVIAGGVNTAGTTYSGTSGIGGDYFNLNGAVASGGFTLGLGAYGNEIHTQSNANQLPVTDSSGVLGNRLYRSTAPVRSTISLSSTVAYQPNTLQPCSITIAGGTVSAISVAQDNVNFDPTGQTAGVFPIAPGGAIKVTFSGSPTTQTQVCY